jgi:hypothetical protein
VRTIFKIFLLCLFIINMSLGSWVYCAQLPKEIFLNAPIKLKNREVVKKQKYLFTRVDLKPQATSSSSLNKSKASLYAQRNFAMYLQGHVQWKDEFSVNEKIMLQALYEQVTTVSAVLKGLTFIRSYSQNGVQSYIYALETPTIKIRKVDQNEGVEKIQKAASVNNSPLDDITYFEMAIRRPDLFSPKIGVRRLSKSCGQNFIFFLLGMDLPDAKTLKNDLKFKLSQLVSLNKFQIAVLLDERPYDTSLSMAFAKRLLETHHEELAKLTIKNCFRLEKIGDVYDEMYKIVQKWHIEPSGSYRYPINSFSKQQLFIEVTNSGLSLNSISQAVLNSLGDIPLKNDSLQQFIPTGDYSNLTSNQLSDIFQELQIKQENAVNSKLFEIIGNQLYAGNYTLMAYCFWHQALYMDPEKNDLRDKIYKHCGKLDLVKYSKLLSP